MKWNEFLYCRILLVGYICLEGSLSLANGCDLSPLLSAEQCQVIEELQDQDFPIIIKSFSVSDRLKTIVVLGERHVKADEDAKLEQRLVKQFKLRLLEGFISNGDPAPMIGDQFDELAHKELVKRRRALLQTGGQKFRSSTIFYAYSHGFLYHLTSGETYFNDCKIGLIRESSFYVSQEIEQFYQSEYTTNQIAFFFQGLSRSLNFVRSLRGNRFNGETVYGKWGGDSEESLAQNHCGFLKENIETTDYRTINISIEYGKESHWENYCKGTSCAFDSNFRTHFVGGIKNTKNIYDSNDPVYLENLENLNYSKIKHVVGSVGSKLLSSKSSAGIPGYRELFMGDNTFRIMKLFRDKGVALIIVGSAHLGFFDHFFSQTKPENGDTRSKWESIAIPTYSKY